MRRGEAADSTDRRHRRRRLSEMSASTAPNGGGLHQVRRFSPRVAQLGFRAGESREPRLGPKRLLCIRRRRRRQAEHRLRVTESGPSQGACVSPAGSPSQPGWPAAGLQAGIRVRVRVNYQIVSRLGPWPRPGGERSGCTASASDTDRGGRHGDQLETPGPLHYDSDSVTVTMKWRRLEAIRLEDN